VSNHVQWLATLSTSTLSDRAVRVATVLALVFVNRDTGQCNPSRRVLAERMGVSEDTVKRALAELRDAGWIVIVPGRWRGATSSFSMVIPGGNVVALHRPSAPKAVQKGGQDCTPLRRGKGCNSAGERGAELPPPIENPGSNPTGAPATAPDRKRTAERPTRLSAVVQVGSENEKAWNAYLEARGMPTLRALGQRASNAEGVGWDAPWSMPPRKGDPEYIHTIAIRWADWASARMMERRSGGHGHAA
jgi:hypothetical protein